MVVKRGQADVSSMLQVRFKYASSLLEACWTATISVSVTGNRSSPTNIRTNRENLTIFQYRQQENWQNMAEKGTDFTNFLHNPATQSVSIFHKVVSTLFNYGENLRSGLNRDSFLNCPELCTMSRKSGK